MGRSETSRGFSLGFGGCFGAIVALICLGILAVWFVGAMLKTVDTARQSARETRRDNEVRAAAALIVESAAFRYGSFGSPEIHLVVRNNTSHVISRAYFRGRVTSPGRTLPWVDEDFNYEIPGGLEPNETATWELRPNVFSDWSNAPAKRRDLILTATPIRIEGATGEVILSDPPAQPAESPAAPEP